MGEGYDLQFGLYGSDPTTPELERTPKPASIAAISGITTTIRALAAAARCWRHVLSRAPSEPASYCCCFIASAISSS